MAPLSGRGFSERGVSCFSGQWDVRLTHEKESVRGFHEGLSLHTTTNRRHWQHQNTQDGSTTPKPQLSALIAKPPMTTHGHSQHQNAHAALPMLM